MRTRLKKGKVMMRIFAHEDAKQRRGSYFAKICPRRTRGEVRSMEGKLVLGELHSLGLCTIGSLGSSDSLHEPKKVMIKDNNSYSHSSTRFEFLARIPSSLNHIVFRAGFRARVD